MTKGKWIPVKGAEGKHSKQAHADMPEGTFEREMSKEGFFGPAAFFHHPRPPTGWTSSARAAPMFAFNMSVVRRSKAMTCPTSWPRTSGKATVARA